MDQSLVRRLAAEAIGSAFLLATVVGSTVMGTGLAGGSAALALFVTSTSTGAMLVVLIWLFGPVSGGHLNPVVSLAFAATGALKWRDLLPYTAAQFAGFVLGMGAAHAMFDLPVLQWADMARTGSGIWLAEGIATFGLILVIIGCAARTPTAVPAAVGLFIAAAYWFTASTALSMLMRLTPGIAGMGSTMPLPGTRKIGQIRSSTVSRFSCTMRRVQSALRLRRIRRCPVIWSTR